MSQRTSVVIDHDSIEINPEQNEITLTFTVVGCFTPTTLSTLNKTAFTCIQPHVRLHGGYLAERWQLITVGDCVRASAIMRAAMASVECNPTARRREITLANTL